MHNIHIIVVQAESGEDACGIAINYMSEWGNDNNWRSAIVAVSEKDKVFFSKNCDNRWDFGTNFGISEINKMIKEWVDHHTSMEVEPLSIMRKILSNKKVKSMEYWELHRWAHHMSNTIDLPKSPDVFKHTFNEGLYDEHGVTHAIYDEDMEKWAVLIDVHS